MKHTLQQNGLAIVAFVALGAWLLVASGCATGPSPQQLDEQALAMMQASFRDQGQAKVDRLQQDEADAACSRAEAAALPEAQAKAIEAASLKTVKPPSDGVYLGDWKEGEKIAQSGRGMTWSDDPKQPNGGNCYNCHQISKEEISFGTLGPSLYQFGKLRGVADPRSADSRAVVEYTWGKLWNARATNACSQMPRFGHKALLDEVQLKHLMALLLDPTSPVNSR
ncbi:MAG TPA: sulfur oxidation c-type cytochrome SoxX [Ideonella sp.]|uniref:sulfur oxidation c-type cytochrome SoxX n=1 Tax=Ideonella sp. TaxID=1929293 RepID=UPI002BD61A04|nr:sulfur oxidation c-type cytochrome SoxX [Ideonella sp.]HSI51637.1 sulfur oxidation c-type cytochrome SoxX [Ideonella sp.]